MVVCRQPSGVLAGTGFRVGFTAYPAPVMESAADAKQGMVVQCHDHARAQAGRHRQDRQQFCAGEKMDMYDLRRVCF